MENKYSKKILGKTRDKDEEDEPKTLFPKPLFFDFPNPRKTPNQMQTLKPKTLFSKGAKTL